MGAIVAILGERGDPELTERLQRMLAQSSYRGEPEFLVEGPLAIGIQSMGWDASLHSSGNWLVAFHGYIGNWGELESAHGWNFTEDATNAQMMAIAYETLGDALFAKLRGEWAVVILDRNHGELIAVRDVVGCRPLFRSENGGRLFLATEIRQIHGGTGAPRAPNEDALAAFLLSYVLIDGRTAHDGVSRILPSRVHRFHLHQPDARPRNTAYWQPPPEKRCSRRDIPGLATEVRHLIERAVTRALPDRPFACCLSGGADSGSIWGIVLDLARRGEKRASRGRSVSLVYPGMARDESSFIRSHRWLPGADPIFIDGSAYRSVDQMEDMANAVDAIHEATLFEVRKINQPCLADGRRVVLGGIGGDEWFWGGAHYLFDLLRRGRLAIALRDGRRLASANRWGLLRTMRSFLPPTFSPRRFSFRPTPPPVWLHGERHDLYRHLQLQKPFDSSDKDSACRRGLLATLTFRQCSDDIVSIEQISSQSDVESRFPLMDLDLIEFAMRTDGHAFVAGERTKHLMRVAMQDVLPEIVFGTVAPSSAIETVARGLPERATKCIDEEWLLTQLRILDPEEHRKTLGMAARGILRSVTHTYDLLATEWFARQNTTTGIEGSE